MRPIPAPFPKSRPRRMRRTHWVRDMVRETILTPADLIWPLFVCEGKGISEPIASMPGVSRHSVDRIVAEADKAAILGIPCIALFPYTPDALKTPEAEEAWNPENLVNRATRHVKATMSYAAKYASSFYGPFRDAVGASGALKGDKKTYQMDFGNRAEALREVAQDIDEGADMVMVKPGMPYLDVCREVKSTFEVPTFAYQVSGEYAMICASAERGWIDREAGMMESLGAFKRAGCDGILTYFAYEAAELMQSR